jgi:hypothetical protein
MTPAFTEKSYIFTAQNLAFFTPVGSLWAVDTSRHMQPFNVLKLPTGWTELYFAVRP